MSLVLLSNDEVFNNGGGISQPNSFTNITESPLIVKANSEVALQSLKILRYSKSACFGNGED